MKKILLTSALILSIVGLAPASVLGEENTTQSTSAVKEAIAKEEKKESSVEENSKSEVLPKVDVQEDKPKKKDGTKKITTGVFTKMINLL